MVGGFSELKEPDERIREILQSIKSEVESTKEKNYDIFECVGYTSQVVAGTNYHIKVRVGEEDHLHIRVFAPLPHTGKACEVKDISGPVDGNTPL